MSEAADTSPHLSSEVVYVLDENLGRAVQGYLSAQCLPGERVDLCGKHWQVGLPDHEWIEIAGRRRLVVITQDIRLLQHDINAAACEAIERHSAVVFVLRASRQSPAVHQGVLESCGGLEAIRRVVPVPWAAMVAVVSDGRIRAAPIPLPRRRSTKTAP